MWGVKKTMKLTPWFPKEIVPVRTGVYLVDDHDIISYAYWDGDGFCYRTYPITIGRVTGPQRAYECRYAQISVYLSERLFGRKTKWRGLTNAPPYG